MLILPTYKNRLRHTYAITGKGFARPFCPHPIGKEWVKGLVPSPQETADFKQASFNLTELSIWRSQKIQKVDPS